MARRKKDSVIEGVVWIILSLITLSILLIIRFLSFSYDLITFFTTGYKKKSGNNFLITYFDKGNYGEFLFYRKLCRVFDKKYILTNLYLKGKNTSTTEIDILALSSKGIYIFEVKNYSGYIFGTEKDNYWTQTLNRRTKNTFYNPLKQNYAHTKAIQNFLNVEINQLHPLVVFSHNSKFKKIFLDDRNKVLQFRSAIRLIKQNEKYGENKFTHEQCDIFLNKLLGTTNLSDSIKNNHIEKVRRFSIEKKDGE